MIGHSLYIPGNHLQDPVHPPLHNTIVSRHDTRPVPAGYHAYAIPPEGDPPTIVMRNWCRHTPETMPVHVLVMDADIHLLDIVGQLLDDETYAATLSPARLTCQQIRHLQPDVIIADTIFNNDGSGNSLIRELEQDQFIKKIPTIWSSMAPEIAGAMSDAGHTVLVKPFDLDDILQTISTMNKFRCCS